MSSAQGAWCVRDVEQLKVKQWSVQCSVLASPTKHANARISVVVGIMHDRMSKRSSRHSSFFTFAYRWMSVF